MELYLEIWNCYTNRLLTVIYEFVHILCLIGTYTQHIHIQYIVPNWNGAQRLGPIYILIWKAELEQFPFHRIPQLMKVLFGNLLDFERNQSGEKSFFLSDFSRIYSWSRILISTLSWLRVPSYMGTINLFCWIGMGGF